MFCLKSIEQICKFESNRIESIPKRNNGNFIDLVKFEQIELNIQFGGGPISSNSNRIFSNQNRKKSFIQIF